MYSLEKILTDPHSHTTPEVIAWLAARLSELESKQRKPAEGDLFMIYQIRIYTNTDELTMSPYAEALIAAHTQTNPADWLRTGVKENGPVTAVLFNMRDTFYYSDEPDDDVANGNTNKYARLLLSHFPDVDPDGIFDDTTFVEAIEMIVAIDPTYIHMLEAARAGLITAAGFDASEDSAEITPAISYPAEEMKHIPLNALVHILGHDPRSSITGLVEYSNSEQMCANGVLRVYGDVGYESDEFFYFAETMSAEEIGASVSDNLREGNLYAAATALYQDFSSTIGGIVDPAKRDKVCEFVTSMFHTNLPVTSQTEVDSGFSHRTDSGEEGESNVPLLDLSDMCR